CLQYKSFPLTF
nr:immunoglobulin light chain junction region [Macaca mulatta]MOV35146.1 immunoglobulin light chain junction region [Macaca mulatta]MOV78155.1 immunoglobulin light chain junction region [Macaca mulatta]MOV80086.1 immunoglobulin light chain junction region [Macaca mulatta]MOV82169.1 immunoglobulin light chain junction region [Macaca mulatta]